MTTIEDVKKNVQAQTTVVKSIVAMIDGLTQQLTAVKKDLLDSGADTAMLDEVIADIQANTDALAQAVARNTAASDEQHAATM